MNRLTEITSAEAGSKTQEVLDKVQSRYGRIPNMMAMLANSPKVLDAYMDFSTGLIGTLSRPLREQIALATAEFNRCAYCLAAHTVGGQRAGLSEEDILAARQFQSNDAKAVAVLQLTRAMLEKRGHLSDDELASAREAGLSDQEIVEVVGTVLVNMFTNYFNILADSEPEQPRVPFLT
jgi:uncharacterized peroxidase-related enzyme